MAGLFEEFGITEDDISAVKNSTPPTPVETPEAPQETTEQPSLFAEYGIDLESVKETAKPEAFTPMSELPQEATDELDFNVEQNEQLALTVFSPEELETIKAKGKIGFFEAKNFLDSEDVLPGGGVFKVAETVQLSIAANKIKNGEETSVGEDELLRQFMRDSIEKNIRGYSIRGGVSNMLMQTPAFMIEFAATAGVGKAAQVATQKAVTKKVNSAVLSKVAGVSANIAARTALMPSAFAGTYGEKRVNEFIAVTDKGEGLLMDADESPLTTALKSFPHAAIEVGSELAGASIGKYIVQPVTGTAARYLRTPINSGIQKLPTTLRHGVYQAYKAINPNAKVTSVFTQAGFNGVLEELGEERLAQILAGTLDVAIEDDITTDDWLDLITPDKDQLLIEAGVMSILGGVRGSSNLMANMLIQDKGMTEAQAKEATDNLSEREREEYIDKNLSVRSKEELPEVEPLGVDVDAGLKETDPIAINHEQSTWQKVYREWSDDLDALQELSNKLKADGKELKPADDFTMLARNSKGVMSTVHHNVRYGTTRFNEDTGTQETTGKGYEPILTDFDAITSTVENDVDVRRADSNRYGIALSVLDDVAISETDGDVKISPEQELQARQDIADLEAKYGDEFVFLQENAKEKTEYAQRVLLNAVDSGLISQETYNDWVEKRPNYLPLQRVFDETEGLSVTGSKNKLFSEVDAGIRKRKGSDREVVDIDKSIITNTARILDASARNRVAMKLAEVADMFPQFIQKIPQPMQKKTVNGEVVYTPSNTPPKGTITAYVNGKPQFFKVSKPLLRAMENMQPEEIGGFTRFITGVVGLIKAGATTFNPDFIFKNPIRDVVGSQIASQGKANLATFARGIKSVVTKDQNYQDALADGTAFDTFMELSDKGTKKALDRLIGNDKFDVTDINTYPVLKQINDLNTLLELAPRVGVYKKMRKNGHSGLVAAQYGRDLTLDFSRGGFKGKKANRYYAFLNAGIQGTDKLRRSFKDHPVETIAYGVATVTVPSIALTTYYLYGADEETRNQYLEIPQWQRDLFWVFKTDSGWKRIPKPFSFGFMFGSAPERMLISAYDGEKPGEAKSMLKFMSELSGGVLSSVSPVQTNAGSVFPSVLKPIVEQIANKDFFRGSDIVPQWKTDIDPDEQKKDSTSISLVSLSQTLQENFGESFSPARMEHLINAYTSSLGRNALDMSDGILKSIKEAQGEEVPAAPSSLQDYPIVRAFTMREPEGYSSQSVSDFYDNLESLRRTHRTFKTKLNNSTLEEAEAYEDKHFNEIMLYEEVNDMFYSEVKELNKIAEEIYDDLDLTGSEKTEELLDVQKELTEIAQEANQYIKENKEK